MADTRPKANRNETSAVAIFGELPIETSARPLSEGEIAALRDFFDLLAKWDEALSQSKLKLRD